eukprot:SAG31_NODE_120_length_23892_cov_10.545623_11_plen_136_part_00
MIGTLLFSLRQASDQVFHARLHRQGVITEREPLRYVLHDDDGSYAGRRLGHRVTREQSWQTLTRQPQKYPFGNGRRGGSPPSAAAAAAVVATAARIDSRPIANGIADRIVRRRRWAAAAVTGHSLYLHVINVLST